jgi:pheromone shutdown protein TraB
MTKIDLIGVNHYSQKSNNKLSSFLLSNYHDVICHEICNYRFNNIDMKNNNLNIIDMSDEFNGNINIKGKIRTSLFSFLYKFSVSYDLAKKLAGSKDIETCINIANRKKVPLALIDKDIRNLLEKFENVSFREFYCSFLSNSFNRLKNPENARSKIEKTSIGKELLESRENYMSRNLKILSNEYDRIGCVVGSVHLEPLANRLDSDYNVKIINTIES